MRTELINKINEIKEKVADGKATKIIIPSEIQSLGGLVSALGEIKNSK